MGSDPARSFKVEWLEEHAIPTKLRVGSQVAAAGTPVVFTPNGNTAVIDSVIFNPRTFDYARVDVAPTSNTVNIERDTNGSTGAIWLAGDIVHVLPPSVTENDNEVYRSASLANDNVFNYTQLVRMNYSLTRTMDNIAILPGNTASKRDQLMNQKFREVREKWELLNVMGGRATGGTAPATRRDAGGLVHYLRNGTLFKDFAGIMTESGFRSFARDYKDENPETVDAWCFCAGNVADIITDWGLDKVRLSPESKKYGLEINQYKAAGITFKIVAMPLLTDTETRGWGFILDMERIRLKILSPLTWYGDALGVGQSERIHDLYRLQAALLVGAENKHAMFVGAKL
jgi:hypothetical protein